MRRNLLIAALTIAAIAACAEAGDKAPAYHPGHYIAIGPTTAVRSVKNLDEPAVRGVNKKYLWKDLEPEQGRYDFSSIRSDLQLLAAHNRQLVVFFTDKSFTSQRVLPEYLVEYEIESTSGSCVQRWHPFVIERLVAMGRAMAEQFDKHPNFEGMAVQESALSMTAEMRRKYGYTPEKYRDAVITILTGLKKEMPNSQVFWYMNFLPGGGLDYLRDIAEALVPYKVVMGGPDILPYRTGLKKFSYKLYEEFDGQLPLFCSAQYDSYRHHKNDTSIAVRRTARVHPEGIVPMEEIFLFARDELNVNYVFWTQVYGRHTARQNSWEDAVNVIRKHPTFNTRQARSKTIR